MPLTAPPESPAGWLADAPANYIGKLHLGTVIVLTIIIFQLLVGLFSGAVAPGLASAAITLPAWVDPALSVFGFAMGGLLLWGWWLLSTPNRDANSASRRWIRAFVTASAVLIGVRSGLLLVGAGTILPSGMPSFATPKDAAFWSITAVELLLSLAAYFAQMLYVAWLARRVPDDWMERRSRLLLWLGPILSTVGIVLLGLGPLIALVLYWNLLDRLRKALKGIRADQATTAIGTAGGVG